MTPCRGAAMVRVGGRVHGAPRGLWSAGSSGAPDAVAGDAAVDGIGHHLRRGRRERPPEMAVARVVEDARAAARAIRGIRLGVIGRRPAQGTTRAVPTSGNNSRVHWTSGLIRAARMSRFSPLNSAVPATRKRSRPRRLVTTLARSSSRLTAGAAARLPSSSRWTVME